MVPQCRQSCKLKCVLDLEISRHRKILRGFCGDRLNYNEPQFMADALAHVLTNLAEFSPQSVVGPCYHFTRLHHCGVLSLPARNSTQQEKSWGDLSRPPLAAREKLTAFTPFHCHMCTSAITEMHECHYRDASAITEILVIYLSQSSMEAHPCPSP